MQLKDCNIGDKVEFWVTINSNGEPSISHTTTDYTNVGIVLLFDTDDTVLVAWDNASNHPTEAQPASSFNNPSTSLLLTGYAWAAWVRNHVEVSRVLPKSGMNCAGKYCNEWNDYGAPNQPNGTYLCWSCKQRPVSMR